jgi:hypothetical protein
VRGAPPTDSSQPSSLGLRWSSVSSSGAAMEMLPRLLTGFGDGGVLGPWRGARRRLAAVRRTVAARWPAARWWSAARRWPAARWECAAWWWAHDGGRSLHWPRGRSDHRRSRPGAIDGRRTPVRKPIPVAGVESPTRVPGPGRVPGTPVSVENERRHRDTECRSAGGDEHGTTRSHGLQKRRVHPAAVRADLHIAPVEALLTAEHLHRRPRCQHHYGGIKDGGSRPQVHAGGERRPDKDLSRCRCRCCQPQDRQCPGRDYCPDRARAALFRVHDIVPLQSLGTSVSPSIAATAQPQPWIASGNEEE